MSSAALRPGEFSSGLIRLIPVAPKLAAVVQQSLEQFVGDESDVPLTMTKAASISRASHGDIDTLLDELSRFGYPSDTIHLIDNYAVTESAKCTQALVGNTFVNAHHVTIALDGQERRVLAFVFHASDY